MSRMVGSTRTASKQGSRAFPMEHKSTTHCNFLMWQKFTWYSCYRYAVWNDATCEKSGRRFFCKFSDVPVFHLRGLSDCQVQHSIVVPGNFIFSFFSWRHSTTSSSGQKRPKRCSRECVPGKAMFARKHCFTKSFKLTITGSVHPSWVPRF